MKIKVLIILFVFSGVLRAKDSISKNHIYFELLGNGGLYSINYERYLSENLTIRVGATDWELHLNGGMLSINEHVTVFPMLVNWIHGETEHKTELGAGIDLFFVEDIDDNEKYSTVVPTGIIGYRYYYNNGWVFRATITSFLIPATKKVFPSIGFSYGIRF